MYSLLCRSDIGSYGYIPTKDVRDYLRPLTHLTPRRRARSAEACDDFEVTERSRLSEYVYLCEIEEDVGTAQTPRAAIDVQPLRSCWRGEQLQCRARKLRFLLGILDN